VTTRFVAMRMAPLDWSPSGAISSVGVAFCSRLR
jgi:hypothetical protein